MAYIYSDTETQGTKPTQSSGYYDESSYFRNRTVRNSLARSVSDSGNGTTLENNSSKPLINLRAMKKRVLPPLLRRDINFSLKNANQEQSLIRARFKINGQRTSYYLPAAYRIETKYWDTAAGCAITDPKKVSSLKGNAHLQNFLYGVNQEINNTIDALISIMESYRVRNIVPTIEEVKADLKREMRGIEAPKEKTTKVKSFFDFAEYYINECKEGRITNSKGMKMSKSSINNYITTLKAIRKYAKARGKSLTVDDITLSFYNDFIAYLNDSEHRRGQYMANTVGKFIRRIKSLAGYAYYNGYTKVEDFKRREFKVINEDSRSIYLNEEELQRIINCELPSNLAAVRDGFILSCYTGLRYSDLSRLENKHINYELNRICMDTAKTGVSLIVPINSIVKSILERYGNKPPRVLSNQKTNELIKEICRKAGINGLVSSYRILGGRKQEVTKEKWELVTFHTARRSLVTNALKNNIPANLIMSVTGHSTERNFMAYARTTKEENANILQTHEFFK